MNEWYTQPPLIHGCVCFWRIWLLHSSVVSMESLRDLLSMGLSSLSQSFRPLVTFSFASIA